MKKILLIVPLLLGLVSFQNSSDNLYDNYILTINEKSSLKNFNKLSNVLRDNEIDCSKLEQLGSSKSCFYLLPIDKKHEEIYLKKLSLINNIQFIERDKKIKLNFGDDINIGEKVIKKENDIEVYSRNYEIVKAREADALFGNSTKINVAVIDTGINANNIFLEGKVDLNASKSFDPDNSALNGYSDHGTSIAYILTGYQKNNPFPNGVYQNINLISISIPEDCSISTFVRAMSYISSLDNVPLVNFSFSLGGDNSQSLKQSIANYQGLFICAAANDGFYLDENYCYPAKYSLDNMIVVGDSNNDYSRASISNYSKNLVDIFGPGQSVWGATRNGGFKVVEGTSYSTPLVTAASAMILSKIGDMSPTQLKNRIMTFADKIDGLKEYCVDGNRLNIYKSVHTNRHSHLSYEYIDSKKHFEVCGLCHDEEKCGHVVSGGAFEGGRRYANCLLCGGLAEIGFVSYGRDLSYVKEHYTFKNGLYYPKKTETIGGILDLSYEDSLKYEKK